MGAGYRGGPERRGKAGQGSREKRSQQQLRHEHAADEQRVRHRHVAERRLTASPHTAEGDPRVAFFSSVRSDEARRITGRLPRSAAQLPPGLRFWVRNGIAALNAAQSEGESSSSTTSGRRDSIPRRRSEVGGAASALRRSSPERRSAGGVFVGGVDFNGMGDVG